METIANISFAFGLSAALVAGVFQSFSDFVMRGLDHAAPASGMDAMRQVNRAVFRSLFLTLLLLLTPASIAFAAYARFQIGGSAASAYLTAASVVYVVFVFFVTMFGNVPMNNKLDGQNADEPAGQNYWRRYLRDWTRLNHLRFLGSLATAILYIAAARALLQSSV
ncbi:MAG: DUF1772 domain-containing protein [Parvularculaceae bacterium]